MMRLSTELCGSVSDRPRELVGIKDVWQTLLAMFSAGKSSSDLFADCVLFPFLLTSALYFSNSANLAG